jgi:hypothetical protein
MLLHGLLHLLLQVLKDLLTLAFIEDFSSLDLKRLSLRRSLKCQQLSLLLLLKHCIDFLAQI